MARSIEQARSEEATRRFFSFRAEEPEPDAPAELEMAREDWERLSPGMRRTITKTYAPKPEPLPDIDPDQELRERKAAVEYAGKKRL